VTDVAPVVDRLAAGLRQLNISGSSALAKRLVDFGELLLLENQSTNLVGAKTLDDLLASHFLDSLAPIAGAEMASPIIDVGSGGGFPGIPVALASPESRVTLFEPRAKRAEFLQKATRELGLSNVEVEKTTAETAGRSAAWRGIAGTVLIRALKRPAQALELGLPLLRPDGLLVLYLGRLSQPDPEHLEAAALLGGELVKATPVVVPYLEGARHVWWFRKTGETPPEYPRRAEVPSKKPGKG
jgi:16S rRNA (guanine527-N7)-methyltransferase